VREDPEAASKQNPGGHSDEASDEKHAENDDDERHGHIQSHQLDGPGRQREHGAQCDAQEGQPAQHIVPGALGPVIGPGVEELLLEALRNQDTSCLERRVERDEGPARRSCTA